MHLRRRQLLVTTAAGPNTINRLTFNTILRNVSLQVTHRQLTRHDIVHQRVALLHTNGHGRRAFVTQRRQFLGHQRRLVNMAIRAHLRLHQANVHGHLVVTVGRIVRTRPTLVSVHLGAHNGLAHTFTNRIVGTLIVVIRASFNRTLTSNFNLAFRLRDDLNRTSNLLVASHRVTTRLFSNIRRAIRLFTVNFNTANSFTSLLFGANNRTYSIIRILANILSLLRASIRVTKRLTSLLSRLHHTLLGIDSRFPSFAHYHHHAHNRATRLVNSRHGASAILTNPHHFSNNIRYRRVNLTNSKLSRRHSALGVITTRTRNFSRFTTNTHTFTRLVRTQGQFSRLNTPNNTTLVNFTNDTRHFTTRHQHHLFNKGRRFNVTSSTLNNIRLQLRFLHRLLSQRHRTHNKRNIITNNMKGVTNRFNSHTTIISQH